MTLLSPGFETKETTLSTTIVQSATGRAALVGKFQWGPAFQIVQVTNEVELVNKFGQPDNNTADYFMSGANFLQYGNDLRVVRVLNTEKAKNSTTLAGNVAFEITNEGSNYKVGDVIKVKYKNSEIETGGKVTKVSTEGKVKGIFIPTGKLIAHAKAVGTYPEVNGYTVEITSGTGNSSASITISSIVTDSGLLLTDLETSRSNITNQTFLTKLKKYDMPAVSAIYAGEIGNSLEVEILSRSAFTGTAPNLTMYPYGGERTAARNLVAYGPQNDNQYAFIVRRDGVMVESFVLSTVKGDKDVYGNSIYMDDFFARGASQYIYATAQGWVDGFSGIISLAGGLSANEASTNDHQNDPFIGAMMQGWDLFAERETIHVNLLIAGACAGEGDNFSTVQKYAVSIGDERQDCLVMVSPPRSTVVNIPVTTAIDNLIHWREGSNNYSDNNMNINTTYAVIDGNYKYQYDKYNDVNRWVPLAADIAGLCARTDAVSQPWMSPAGYNRGQIMNVVKLAIEPRKAHRDRLYQAAINPVIGAGGEGFILMGDKTATTVPSPFDRINVRRLFNMLKKNIGDSSKYKLFENNDNFTRASFRMEVSQYLSTIRSLGGIYDFRVQCDTTNNTPDVIDRNEFVASMFIKPAKSINYIMLNFTAVATGADFDEIIGPANQA
ncbi:tail sheath protein [Shigella phage JK32]|nr:tail sheath protein [Shigella phage JK32]